MTGFFNFKKKTQYLPYIYLIKALNSFLLSFNINFESIHFSDVPRKIKEYLKPCWSFALIFPRLIEIFRTFTRKNTKIYHKYQYNLYINACTRNKLYIYLQLMFNYFKRTHIIYIWYSKADQTIGVTHWWVLITFLLPL